ncbi:ImmA/IrrE family metallo-endopeptidase [Lysinibacillus sp. fls2-241-R2A-57]|nr:ImmA/IrrE family metallo-endopeptidase [Lysinibacillus sp. fls2-241-R2A-57]
MSEKIKFTDLLMEFGEQLAEITARRMLENNFGSSTFIGAYIEQFVRNLSKSAIIYEYMNDPFLFGGKVQYYKDGKEDSYVFINTYQSYRVQYFTLAHELFHLTPEHEKLIKAFDANNSNNDENLKKVVERSADRFAATLLLPENLVKGIWEKLIDEVKDQERIIYNLADMSCAPYEAVARRLVELNLHTSRKLDKSFKDKIKNYKDSDWEKERIDFMAIPSPLDIAIIDNEKLYKQRIEDTTPNPSTSDEEDPLKEFL